ncbi:MAG: hypothetical protein JNM18_06535, partial [Planctomycetaceae bacterium]|nr:hypothetical protein [Planctomycetaceae bacterium]
MIATGRHLLGIMFVWMAISRLLVATEPTFAPADVEFFEKRVRPILVERCYACHAKSQGKER